MLSGDRAIFHIMGKIAHFAKIRNVRPTTALRKKNKVCQDYYSVMSLDDTERFLSHCA